MRKLLFLIFFMLTAVMALPVAAQSLKNDYVADSMKKSVSKARTDWDRVVSMQRLAMYFNNIDSGQSEQYARQALGIAEMSRDRKLMATAYLNNGRRYLNTNTDAADKIEKAMDNFRQAERIARENGLEDQLVQAYSYMAEGSRNKGDNDKALEYSNLAVASISSRDNDTIRVRAYTSLGDTYVARNEKLLAFRNYLEASDIAETSKNPSLIRDAYSSLSNFYGGIPEYDKAIDYEIKVTGIDLATHDNIDRMNDYRILGSLFEQEKQYDLALKMYEQSIALADTMHFDLYKVNPYLNIFLMYFKANQFQKGVDYSNQHPVLMEIVRRAELQYYTDEAYGSAYTDMGRFDSAAFYFRRAEPMVEAKTGVLEKYDFYNKAGNFYKKKGDNASAIMYYLKGRAIGKLVKSLAILQSTDSSLDILYTRSGDYKTAHFYNSEYGLYTDSIRSLARDADLLKLEVDNDNRRRERLTREDEINTEHRHNVQYMGFTIGLIVLFLSLVMLGFFAISPQTIRALGFFSFIFLFEFIILLADRQIHEWTHGEPWKILLIKIGLAAILLPLHHWLEHTVIHYLTSRRKIKAPGAPFWKKSGDAPAQAPAVERAE